MNYYASKIKSHQQISSDIYVLELEREAGVILPGQFYMLKICDNHLPLMRPVSIYKISDKTVSFMYRIAGEGTKLLSQLKKGNFLKILGPLGNGFPCDEVSGRIALVGGGIGIPPLLETARKLKKLNCSVDIYLGYKDELFAFEEFEDVADRIFISMESGDEGYSGYITDLLKVENYQTVFTCGAEVMMLKIRDLCLIKKIPIWLSMEKRMACGIGACLVCACETKYGMKRCCKDGPVFRGEEII